MSTVLAVAIVAPAAGALCSLALAASPLPRRFAVRASVAVALAAGGVVMVRAATGEAVLARGYLADAWRALLVLGALAAAGAGLARRSDAEADAVSAAAVLGAAAAAAASLVAGGLVTASALLVATTACYALTAGLAQVDGERVPALRAWRSCAGYAASDLLVLVAALVASGSGLGTPPRPGTAAGALLLAAAAIRLGLVPVAGVLEDAVRSGRAAGAIALGAMRAQGIALAWWSLGAGDPLQRVAGGLGAATAVWGALRAAREGSLAAVASAHAGLVVLALSAGGAGGVRAAVLLAAAGFVAWPLLLAGGRSSGAGRASAGLWAAGAALPGMVLLVETTAGAGRASGRPLASAVAAAVSALLLIAAAPRIRSWEPEDAPARGVSSRDAPAWSVERSAPPSVLWTAPALGAALAIAAIPGRALANLAVPAAASLGAGTLLQPGGASGFADALGVVVVTFALVALAASFRGLRPRAGAERPPPRAPRWSAWWGAAPPVPSARSSAGRERAARRARAWFRVAALAGAAAAVLAAVLYGTGVTRGFL